MASYLVRANPKRDLLSDLRRKLDSGEIEKMRPFGRALHQSLTNAKLARDGSAFWEEEDYCNPPLAQERAAVLDIHFDRIQVEQVSEGEGWKRIKDLRPLWSSSGQN